jgi:uncharacterized membrane protein YbhN (UPF0104 family)
LKKLIIPALKIVLPIAIIGWLCVRAQQENPEIFARLWTSQKNWGLLGLSVTLIFAANTLCFVRWYVLLRAIEIDISIFNTLRLGFLGFLFGFVAPGQLGGDLFKAVFIAREQRERRGAAVATILIDRVCGLYGLLVVTATGLLVTGLASEDPYVGMIAKATYSCAILGAAGIVVLLIPGMTRSRLAMFAAGLPRIGLLFRRIFIATDMFRRQKPVLILIGVVSICVHVLNAVGLFVGARGIYGDAPTLMQHLVISPLAGVAGALPLFPGGAGTYEAAINILYDLFSPANAQGRGLVIGLMYRFATIIVAGVGLVFYWRGRREVEDVIEQVKSETTLEPRLQPHKSVP